jgi:hypothetical protein
MPETELIEILLYKGTSRTYDLFVFELNQQKNQQADFDQLLAEVLDKQKKAMELEALKEKVKDFKTANKELKDRIANLESELKNSNTMNDLTKLISQSGLLQKGMDTNLTTEQKHQENPPELLGGISNEELITIWSSYKTQLGDDTFQSFLGTCLVLGEHPELIPAVRTLIDTSIKTQNHE